MKKIFSDIEYKYFKEDKVKYIRTSDAIDDDHYISYRIENGKHILLIGSNNGEIPVRICRTPEEFEKHIKLLLEVLL